jgi:hypothetical protein
MTRASGEEGSAADPFTMGRSCGISEAGDATQSETTDCHPGVVLIRGSGNVNSMNELSRLDANVDVAISVAGSVAGGREGRVIASPEARPLGTREHRREVTS